MLKGYANFIRGQRLGCHPQRLASAINAGLDIYMPMQLNEHKARRIQANDHGLGTVQRTAYPT